MSWRKRISMAIGLLFVLVLAAGLTMVVNFNSGKVESKSASLAAEDYPVGTDYSGTVTAQHVHVGDHVEAGQPLFEVQSATLQRDLSQDLVSKDNLTHEVKDDTTLIITATNTGQVDEINYSQGAFVPANSTIATVQTSGTMYVEADFLLSAKDYSRIPSGAGHPAPDQRRSRHRRDHDRDRLVRPERLTPGIPMEDQWFSIGMRNRPMTAARVSTPIG